MNGAFGTFSLADIARQAQDGALRKEQITTMQQNREQSRQASEIAQQREQAAMIAKLTEGVQDEQTYQQRLQAAAAYGMDTSQLPQSFEQGGRDFVQTYNVLATTLLRPDGERKLTNTAQELVDAGYQPGTPQFIAAMRNRLTMQDSKVITTQAGGAAGLLGPNGYQQVITPNDGSQQAGAPVGGGANRKVVGGKAYVNRDGQWYEEGAASNGSATF